MSVEMPPALPPQAGEVQSATPKARRRTLTFFILVSITTFVLIVGVEQWISQIGDDSYGDPQQAIDDLAYVIRILGAVISLSLIGLALVVARVSWRVYAARRFPPPGMSLAVDVTVVEGPAAIRRAFAGFAASMLLGGLAVVLPYVLLRAMFLLVGGAPG